MQLKCWQIVLVAVAAQGRGQLAIGAPARPNIVFILADDMGWGTGQFNNPDSPIATPHLNALAASGVNFTRNYAATVCSPTRSMLLTGYHTGHGSNDRNGNISAGLRPEEVTAGEVLQSAGYETSVWGKWGWGGSGGGTGDLRANPIVNNAQALPQNQGFEYFYGYLNHSRAHSYFVDSLWTTAEPTAANKYRPTADNGLWLERTGNTAATPTAAYSHDLIAAKAEQYLAERAGETDPFYMQVSYTIPHQLLTQISSVPGGLGQYANHPTMTTREKQHAAMVTRMDASIGSLINRLDDPNGDGDKTDSVLANTLIIFSSDNGPTPEGGLSNAGLINLDLTNGLRGGKRDLYEGGIRTPLLVRWDAGLAPSLRGAINTRPTDLTDFIATAAEVAGTLAPLGVDGVSLAPTLTGLGVQRDHAHFVSENFENSGTGNQNADWSITRGSSKLIKFRTGAFELFDLSTDPFEASPLSLSVAANAALKNELEATALAEGVGQADGYFVQYATWTGPNAGELSAPANWSPSTAPQPTWAAVVNNSSATERAAIVASDVSVLAIEVRGEGATQVLNIPAGRTLTGRNEVRISAGGRLELIDSTVRSSRWVELLPGGELSGQGAVQAAVYSRGRIAPGTVADATGRIEIQGALVLLEGSEVVLEIASPANPPGGNPQFDQVVASGATRIAGAIKLSTASGYLPPRGSVFDLVVAPSVSGTFQEVRSEILGSALQFQVEYLTDRVRAVVTTVLPGDFNADGHVDAADFTEWRDQLGATVLPYSGADANGDGSVSEVDYDIWKDNFGRQVSAATSATNVGEPAAIVILLSWLVSCGTVGRSHSE